MTPSRELMVKQLAQSDYHALSKVFVKTHTNAAIEDIGKIIKQEIKHICSNTHNSLLRSYGADIKTFSWQAVWDELKENAPHLQDVKA